MPADSPIHKIADLKGKKIGVASTGGLTYWLTLELARHEGWPKDALQLAAIGNAHSAVVSSLRTGNVDAVYSSTAVAFFLEKKHQGRLLVPASSYVGDIGSGMIFARDSLIAEKPDAVRRFVAGWLETIAFMTAHPDEAIKAEAAVTTFPMDVQTKEFHLTFPMFSHNCSFDPEAFANLKRSFVDMKMLPKAPDMAKLYTTAFLPKS